MPANTPAKDLWKERNKEDIETHFFFNLSSGGCLVAMYILNWKKRDKWDLGPIRTMSYI